MRKTKSRFVMRKTKSIVADLLHVLKDIRHSCTEAENNHLYRRKIRSEQEGGNRND